MAYLYTDSAEMARWLAEQSPEQLAELRSQGQRRIDAENEHRRRVRMTDPHGTVRWDPHNDMFLVRYNEDDYDPRHPPGPDDDPSEPYWVPYTSDGRGIPVDDGSFDPDTTVVVGEISNTAGERF